jgi:hypothetical protein
MTMGGARTVGWKRFMRLAGALALPAMVVLGIGTATVHADGPPRCEGGPDRVAREGCGDRDQHCERDRDCDRDHDPDERPMPTSVPRSTLGPAPSPTPGTTPTPVPGAASVLTAAGATSRRGPGAAPVEAVSPAASSAPATAGRATPSPSPSPAGVQPASLSMVRPARVLVDLPLVRLLVIAVVVGVAAAVLPRAVRWRR